MEVKPPVNQKKSQQKKYQIKPSWSAWIFKTIKGLPFSGNGFISPEAKAVNSYSQLRPPDNHHYQKPNPQPGAKQNSRHIGRYSTITVKSPILNRERSTTAGTSGATQPSPSKAQSSTGSEAYFSFAEMPLKGYLATHGED
jgi:hypothetical protein